MIWQIDQDVLINIFLVYDAKILKTTGQSKRVTSSHRDLHSPYSTGSLPSPLPGAPKHPDPSAHFALMKT